MLLYFSLAQQAYNFLQYKLQYIIGNNIIEEIDTGIFESLIDS